MYTLVANTITEIVNEKDEDKIVRVVSDSTTMTRIGTSEEQLQLPGGGHVVLAYESVYCLVPAKKALYAVSTGTPNISATEVVNYTGAYLKV